MGGLRTCSSLLLLIYIYIYIYMYLVLGDKKWTFVSASSTIVCIFEGSLISQPSKTKKH